MVALAIGVRPRKELAEAAGLVCDRGVIVDEYLRASEEHIFAAGDLAESQEAPGGRNTVEVLWSSAVAKGQIAGLNMAGEPEHVYRPGLPMNVTRLAGLKVTIMGRVGEGDDADLEGVSRGDSEAWRRRDEAEVVESRPRDAHLRLTLLKNRIVGAVVVGAQESSFPLHALVGSQVNIALIREQLLRPRAPVAALLQDFWRDWAANGAR
jgi:NAD(P)H-nitrite reductase large subunit